jgi:hypothetical protein
MSQGLIELVGEDVLCSVVGGAEVRLPYAAAAARLAAWATRYDPAAARDAEGELSAIGQEMFAWLDEAGWASGWADGPGDRALEIRVRRRDDPREVALLDAPWELLARDSGPLALDETQLFAVARRIGVPAAAWEPRDHDLQLMFMAAAPQGQAELDFEREEAAVLAATRGDGRVHVVVEETGALDFLRGRLTSEEGPFEAVHLSCHGTSTRPGGRCCCWRRLRAAPIAPALDRSCRRSGPHPRRFWCSRRAARQRSTDRAPQAVASVGVMRPTGRQNSRCNGMQGSGQACKSAPNRDPLRKDDKALILFS